MIPWDVIMSPTLLAAITEWRDPRWAEAGAPYPGMVKAAEAWHAGAPLRVLALVD